MLLPYVLSIVGKKNSGKTTLIEKLIPHLIRMGYKVGTVKHDTHGFDIDHEGKDTWRHKAAGASTVVISCPWKISMIKDLNEERTLDQIIQDHFADADLVLTEGYKRAGKPQIEVYRRLAHTSPLHTKENQGTLIGLVSDTYLDLGVPFLEINDISSIARFVQKRIMTRTSGLVS